jgi:hypothetical protein
MISQFIITKWSYGKIIILSCKQTFRYRRLGIPRMGIFRPGVIIQILVL